MDTTPKKLEDNIPSTYLDRFATISKESWKHDDFRKRVLEICADHSGSHEFVKKMETVFEEALKKEIFIEKVKAISKAEITTYIDKSRIKTVFWIIGLVVTTIVGLVLEKIFHVLG